MTTSPFISVIIVNYNSGDRLRRCISHLQRQTFDNFDVIVVDNGSTDNSMDFSDVSSLRIENIFSEDNIGFAAANNLAAKRTKSEWIAFLNPDAYASAGWLEELTKAVQRYPDADAFGSTQIDAANNALLDGAGDAYFFAGAPYRGHFGWPVERLPTEGECFAPCAAAAMYRKKVFEELGGFEETFFCYGEDVDLGFRLRLSGRRAIQVKSACVEHEGSGVTGRSSDFTIYHGHRNRIWTYYRNMPLMLLIISLPFHIAINIYLYGRFLVNGTFVPYARAVIDALNGLSEQNHARRRIQNARRLSTASLSRCLVWSPVKLFKREAVTIRENKKPPRQTSHLAT